MLRDIRLLVVRVIVGVDEDTALDAVASPKTVVDGVGEGVGHVGSVLSGGSDSLTGPVAVRSDNLVV